MQFLKQVKRQIWSGTVLIQQIAVLNSSDTWVEIIKEIHVVRQSSAIKGIDWLDKNILLSLLFNWDEAFFQETVPI